MIRSLQFFIFFFIVFYISQDVHEENISLLYSENKESHNESAAATQKHTDTTSLAPFLRKSILPRLQLKNINALI